jgi:replicative DNA helicase
MNLEIKNYDTDIEAGLLGCIGKNTENWADALERGFSPEWFMNPLHYRIAEQMLSEDKKGKEVDDISIAFSMPEESRAEVIEAFDRVETTAHFNKFLEEIEGLWLKRKTIEACHGIIQMASERGSRALDVVEKGGSEFSQLSLKEKSKLKTGAEVVQAAWEGILERQKVGGVNGVPSGIKSLDKMCCGWQKNDLITLAARTSVGKTAFSIEMALGALRAGKTVQFFSLEMVNESVMERMLANVSGVPVRVMVDKVMTEGQIKAVEKARQFLSVAPLFMEDAGDMTVSTIRAKARKLARKGLDMIVVDYCQIVKPEDSKISREQQVSSITWGLKTLAKELKIPVIMLSQVNRNADGTNACPRLSDLADSDKVGRDADLVLMLWKKDDGSETKTFIEVAKQRNGRLGPIELDFKASLQKFEEKITSSLN